MKEERRQVKTIFVLGFIFVGVFILTVFASRLSERSQPASSRGRANEPQK